VGTISVLLVDGSCSLKVIRPIVAQSYTIQILSKAYMESHPCCSAYAELHLLPIEVHAVDHGPGVR
jgi:hypothetical protein